MATATEVNLDKYCADVAARAKRASMSLGTVPRTVKDNWLRRSAELLRENEDRIAEANERDLAAAPGYGLTDAAIDRLRLNSKRIDEIGKRDVIALLDSINDRGAPVMARRVKAHVRRFFHWCLERDILKIDPTAGLPRVGNGKSRDRVLTDSELAKVLRACQGPYGAVVRLLALTGARREEIAKLKWSEIDGDTIKLEGSRTKTGEPHTIPLSSAAQALLNSLPHLGDFVFNGVRPVSNWSHSKNELDAASGVTNWRIHDLRRTVATGLQKLGFNLQTIEAVLGHASGSRSGVVGVYQRHSFDAEKRAALEVWGAHVMALS